VARTRKATLLDARPLSASVRSLRFETADRAPVGHVAGQYLDLVVPTGGGGLPFRRSYSIASAPEAGRPEAFEIAVTRVDGGPTSEALHRLGLGETVEIEGPRGTFVRRDEDRTHSGLFVAAGTGLAPIRAMLSEEVRRPEGPPLALLFGCRTPADVLWGEELRAWARSCPRFRLHVTLSRPPSDWAGLVGYVQRHATELTRRLPDVRAYVCGLGAMVEDVTRALERDASVPRDALRYEPYD
jgi:ferredoxin-NADP reductase